MIRDALPEDTLEIAKLAKQFENESKFVKVDVYYTAKQYADYIRDGKAKLFVYEEDGKIIGSFGFMLGKDQHCGALTAYEAFWYVHPDKRGCGIKLLLHAEKWASENVERMLIIHMVDSQPEALKKIYERRGFVLVEQSFLKEF